MVVDVDCAFLCEMVKRNVSIDSPGQGDVIATGLNIEALRRQQYGTRGTPQEWQEEGMDSCKWGNPPTRSNCVDSRGIE